VLCRFKDGRAQGAAALRRGEDFLAQQGVHVSVWIRA
jgi:hypothetical protein